jgi:hypothetical protein
MNTNNLCGGCTACCTSHGVRALDKLPHTACAHCESRGCSIYERRPGECSRFTCSWLQGKGGGNGCRPDKTGVVPEHEYIAGAGMILVLTEYSAGSLQSTFAFNWTRRNLFAGNFTLQWPIQGKGRFYFPKGESPTLEQQNFFQEYWKRDMDFITFDLFLRGLVL